MLYKTKDVMGIASIFVFILTAAIALTILATPIYQFSLNWLDVPEKVGLSYDQIMANYRAVMEYLHFPWVNELVFPDFPVSESGAFHFWEVKILFYINYAALFISSVISFFYIRHLKQINGLWRLIQPFKIAIFVPFVLLVILAIDFDAMFVLFHEIAFNNDAWIFSPVTDPIITVLPQAFFMLCFAFAFILIEGSFIAGYFLSKRQSNSN